MYYRIVERFGPEDGEAWEKYLAWRGLKLTSFDSVDGILRPGLFREESDDDWRNCDATSRIAGMITNRDYALRVLSRYANAVLVGVDVALEDGYVPEDGLLGFDIVDGCGSISLITNCGVDEVAIINPYVMPNGLIGDLSLALLFRDLLRTEQGAHTEGCEVWAVYG